MLYKNLYNMFIDFKCLQSQWQKKKQRTESVDKTENRDKQKCNGEHLSCDTFFRVPVFRVSLKRKLAAPFKESCNSF